ncbi:MAG: aldo/keto reductase [Flavobacteriaceae bacterium]|nr:aldo/keto reductase [Flavobacteriaceae bacterium]
MNYKNIPNTNLKVSELCLGTMTFGEQNTQEEAFGQLDFALENGINFIDTAEMYSVPGRKETQGSTETIIGNWFAKTGYRKKVILASKIAGPSRTFEHIREPLDFSRVSLNDAINKSLKRLQTDYIDLYQLHWPERNTNYFGQRNYNHNPNEKWEDNIAEVLENLEFFVKEGKIRHIGVSNESPFGVMRFVEEARKGKRKIVSVQNPFSLLNRKDEVGLTEILMRENIGYLPYSPLGFGQLTGKYLEDSPKNARVTLFPNYNRYHKPNGFEATRRYNTLAKQNNLSLTHLALAFIRHQPFVTSTILGATTISQLKENIESKEVVLSKELLSEINKIHEEIPNPAP